MFRPSGDQVWRSLAVCSFLLFRCFCVFSFFMDLRVLAGGSIVSDTWRWGGSPGMHFSTIGFKPELTPCVLVSGAGERERLPPVIYLSRRYLRQSISDGVPAEEFQRGCPEE